jgi:hypothetical protein
MTSSPFALVVALVAALLVNACQADDDLCVAAGSMSDACGLPLSKAECKKLSSSDAEALVTSLRAMRCSVDSSTREPMTRRAHARIRAACTPTAPADGSGLTRMHFLSRRAALQAFAILAVDCGSSAAKDAGPGGPVTPLDPVAPDSDATRPIVEIVRVVAFVAYLGAPYSDAGLVAVGFPPYEDFASGLAVSGYPRTNSGRLVDAASEDLAALAKKGELDDYTYDERRGPFAVAVGLDARGDLP